jgi:hypothetical protein
MLMVIRLRRILAAFLPATMFLPAPMLHPAFVLLLAFTHLPTMFLTASTTPIPVGLPNGKRLPDSWNGPGMSRRRSHRSDYQQANNCKAREEISHCPTSSEQDGGALR